MSIITIAAGVLVAAFVLFVVLPAVGLAFVAALGVVARLIVVANEPITFTSKPLAWITRKPATERERGTQGLCQLAALLGLMLAVRLVVKAGIF